MLFVIFLYISEIDAPFFWRVLHNLTATLLQFQNFNETLTQRLGNTVLNCPEVSRVDVFSTNIMSWLETYDHNIRLIKHQFYEYQ
jgi:hypothetical protein